DKEFRDYKIAWTDGWPGFETSSQIQNVIKELADKLKDNKCTIEKKIPDETLHRDSLETFVGIFPYIIAQGVPWFIRPLIKMQLFGGFLKGIKQDLPYLVNPEKPLHLLKTKGKV
ncbi:MAG TPA: hypothetical protein PK289_14045, partial [Bacteroidia bacterium]|nr:hypothetical protein [Bacteroidia bacterium]